MLRTLWVWALLVVLAARAHAQQEAAKPETLIRLNVAPAAAPKPALKYVLLPELKEMSPGNPIQGYLKCMLEQYRFVFDEHEFKRRTALLAAPLDEVPAPQMEELGRLSLAQVDRAARLDNPDWQILLKLKADGFNTLLPDVQTMRSLARALAARFRVEVAGGRVDDAIRTAKTMFAMARHLGEHPTYIGDLVGMAIAAITIGPLEELLQQPECPNLYWALTDLPIPLVSMRLGIEGERLTVWWLFRDLDSTAPMTPEQIKRFIDPLDKLLADTASSKAAGGVRGYLAARTKDELKVAAARRRLVDFGLPEARVKTFPADQVILLDEGKREYLVTLI